MLYSILFYILLILIVLIREIISSFLFCCVVFLTEGDSIKEELDGNNALPSELRKRKRAQSDMGKKKRIENVTYFGFNKNEFSELPNFLEAPQILNLVTNTMSFKVSTTLGF
jgi:hypothetical protein